MNKKEQLLRENELLNRELDKIEEELEINVNVEANLKRLEEIKDEISEVLMQVPYYSLMDH